MWLILKADNYKQYQWSLCGDRGIIGFLMSIQEIFTKYFRFFVAKTVVQYPGTTNRMTVDGNIVGHQIIYVLKDKEFKKILTLKELRAWEAFVNLSWLLW